MVLVSRLFPSGTHTPGDDAPGARGPPSSSSSFTSSVASSVVRSLSAPASSFLAPSSSFCARPEPPLVCAHGTVGASAWPADAGMARPLPNTVPALAAAVAAGHECVEVDVSATSDGHLVALHKRELELLTNGASSDPNELTLREILALEVPGGDSTYGVATFAEALRAVIGRGLAQVTIDFKHRDDRDPPPGFAQRALAEISLADPEGMCPECVFWGKSDALVMDVLREEPEAKVGFTVANFSRAMTAGGLHRVDATLRPVVARAHVAATQSEMAMDEGVRREIRRAGVPNVFAWTVNDPKKIRAVANEGVDGVVTDEPELAKRVIAAMRAKCAAASSGNGADRARARAVARGEEPRDVEEGEPTAAREGKRSRAFRREVKAKAKATAKAKAKARGSRVDENAAEGGQKISGEAAEDGAARGRRLGGRRERSAAARAARGEEA